jgi:hypothetical protein
MLNYSLLSAATIHVLEIPAKGTTSADFTEANIRALHNIAQTLQDLHKMSENHIYATRAIKIIHGLAEQYGKSLPGNNMPNPDAFVAASTPASPFSPATPTKTALPVPHSFMAPDDLRNRDDNVYDLQIPEYGQVGGSVATFRHSPSLSATPSSMSSSNCPPVTSNPVTPRIHISTAPSLGSSEASTFRSQSENGTKPEKPPNMFWTPFEGAHLPLYSQNFNASPMDLSSMLGTVDPWEQFIRDGFRVSDTWGQDPLFGINGNEPMEQQIVVGENQRQDPPTGQKVIVDRPISKGMTIATRQEPIYQQEWWPPR